MAFYIGIDGGGTKTNLVLADENLKIITKISGGKTNPLIIGTDNSAKNLFRLIKSAVAKSKITSLEYVVAGLAGCGRKKTSDEVKQKLELLLLKLNVKVNNILVLSDAEITLEGCFPGTSGAILIAGTGSIAFGKNSKGRIFRSGGFGKIIGDEGSGYSIGRKALITAAKSFDGRGPESSIEKYLKKIFDITDADTLITKVHSGNFDIASVAEYVIKCAEEGDKVCRNILERESDKLIQLVLSLKKKIGVKKLKLCLWGGLFSSRNYYVSINKNRFNKSYQDIELVQPAHTPEIGAVLLALRDNKFNGIKIRK